MVVIIFIDHLNHQRHYSVQHQSIHHHLPHQAGGIRGHPPHHLPVPTTMHPEADIHIEQHASLEGFPPHHVNGYKLLVCSMCIFFSAS